jgi:hypothetical protein
MLMLPKWHFCGSMVVDYNLTLDSILLQICNNRFFVNLATEYRIHAWYLLKLQNLVLIND